MSESNAHEHELNFDSWVLDPRDNDGSGGVQPLMRCKCGYMETPLGEWTSNINPFSIKAIVKPWYHPSLLFRFRKGGVEWRPDTCKCVVYYRWMQIPLCKPIYYGFVARERCDKHADLNPWKAAKAALAENQRVNRAIAHAKKEYDQGGKNDNHPRSGSHG